VNERLDLRGGNVEPLYKLLDAAQDAQCLVARSRGGLGKFEPVRFDVIEGQVGERASDIHAQTKSHQCVTFVRITCCP
jgi:hypothetical protein